MEVRNIFYNSNSFEHRRRFKFQSLKLKTCGPQRQIRSADIYTVIILWSGILSMRSLVMHLRITILLREGKYCSVSLWGRFLRKINAAIDLIIYLVYWNAGGLYGRFRAQTENTTVCDAFSPCIRKSYMNKTIRVKVWSCELQCNSKHTAAQQTHILSLILFDCLFQKYPVWGKVGLSWNLIA